MTREEAIEVYNGLINTKIKEAFEFFAPELAESEDERIRKDIISHLAKGIEGSSFDEVREKYKIWIAWLEKQGEQKPAWSKEDEKKRTLLISILEVSHPYGYFKVNPANTLNMEAIHIEELVDRLKSLRPQNHWKPNEEQMKALANALSLAKSCGEESAFDLRTLYEQLKKLREERL